MSEKLIRNYNSFCKENHFENNSYQTEVIKKLQKFYNENFKFSFFDFFSKKNKKKGFYLYGDVGVGKTMILNFFFNFVKEKKLKLHLNEFMLSYHNFAHENKKSDKDIIHLFVKNLKSKASLIFFDEFQVTNIVDAMILGKLFENIYKEDIKIILTSNIKISNLYKDGLQRDQFKPFINIMEQKTFEHHLVIEEDYRKSKENEKQRYFFPLNEETNFRINKFFRIITKDKKNLSKILNIKGRDFIIKDYFEGVSRFDFDELCDQNLGAEDYLEIVKVSNFIVIENLPCFDDFNVNQQQRFITLMDIIYDKNIPIAITSNQNLDELTSSKFLEKEFKRTISRLHELTSISHK